MAAFAAYAPVPTPTHPDAAAAFLGLILLVFATAFLPILWRWMTNRRFRYVSNVCGRCGYSLIGLPSPVCPECGADTRVVGTGRAVDRMRGTWIAYAVWLGAVWWILEAHQWRIDGYLLRVVWGRAYQRRIGAPDVAELSALRNALVVSVAGVGVLAIYGIERLLRRRHSADVTGRGSVL